MIFPNQYQKLAPICTKMALLFPNNKRMLKNENLLSKEFLSRCQWFKDNNLPVIFEKVKLSPFSILRGEL